MILYTSINPFEIDTLARTRVTVPARSPATRLGDATVHALWHGWRGTRRAALELALALRVARERRALARLDDHELHDVGLDRAAAEREAARGFLDLPRSRRR